MPHVVGSERRTDLGSQLADGARKTFQIDGIEIQNGNCHGRSRVCEDASGKKSMQRHEPCCGPFSRRRVRPRRQSALLFFAVAESLAITVDAAPGRGGVSGSIACE